MSNFIQHALTYDEDTTLLTISNVFSSQKFQMFKTDHVTSIIKYLKYLGKEGSLKNLIQDIMNIVKGMGQLEAIMHYSMKVAHYEMKHKK
jgi:hypothetical protein